MRQGRYRAGPSYDWPPDLPWRRIASYAPHAVLAALAVWIAWAGYYTVEPHEQVVLLRFGQFRGVEGPGLHFKVPFVDRAVFVDAAEHSVRLPVLLGSENWRSRTTAEPLMLTADLNAAVVEWTIQWRVRDPDKFLFSIDQRHVEPTLEAVAQSVMHRLVGDYSIDEILTGKREEVGMAAQRATQQLLDGYQCGIQITGLQMQRVTPPERVKASFDEVNASIQTRDRLINEANRERNRLIPTAEGQRDKLIREAEGYAARRRAEAQGEIAALLAQYEAYQAAPAVTRQRLYIEAMEEVLGAVESKTILDAELTGLVPLLQLDRDGSRPAATSAMPPAAQPPRTSAPEPAAERRSGSQPRRTQP